MTIRHATHIEDFGVAGFQALVERAHALKQAPHPTLFAGKILGMLFFNPSLRTRTSFEAAMVRGGGHAIVLDVGAGVWNLEYRDGAVMNADRAEHIREAAPVLTRYLDALAVRTFAGGLDPEADNADPVIRAFRKYATKPVISMESAREHPCQGLADMLTLRERFGTTEKLDVALTWAPHVKPLPQAVPNSFLLSAAAAGCNVRVAYPEGFDLHPSVVSQAREYALQAGGSVSFTHDQREAMDGAACVYAKAWGPVQTVIGDAEHAKRLVQSHNDWLVTRRKLDDAGEGCTFMHCLPTRRNVEIADDVLDHPLSLVTDEAENRLHVQRALISWAFNF